MFISTYQLSIWWWNCLILYSITRSSWRFLWPLLASFWQSSGWGQSSGWSWHLPKVSLTTRWNVFCVINKLGNLPCDGYKYLSCRHVSQLTMACGRAAPKPCGWPISTQRERAVDLQNSLEVTQTSTEWLSGWLFDFYDGWCVCVFLCFGVYLPVNAECLMTKMAASCLDTDRRNISVQ